MSAREFVVIGEMGCYSDRGVVGVWASFEDAVTALHEQGWKWELELGAGDPSVVNDQDWGQAVTLRRMEIGAGDARFRVEELLTTVADYSAHPRSLRAIEERDWITLRGGSEGEKP